MRNLIFISLLFVSALSFGQLKPGIVASSGGEAAVTNMITNGDFTSSSYWSFDPDGQWTITTGNPGTANYAATSGSWISQDPDDMVTATEADGSYTLTFTCSGTITTRICDHEYSQNWAAAAEYAAGTHNVDFTIGSTALGNGGIGLRAESSTPSAVTITNMILVEQ